MSPGIAWSQGHDSQRQPLLAGQVVATSHPLAAQAGLAMLAAGGSAADAAVATAAAMTVCEPTGNGLGSDAFAIVATPEGGLHGLNASGRAPAAWTPAYFERRHPAAAAPPARGWDAVTVPGAVAGWAALHRRFGRLPFEQLLAPAIALAERGHPIGGLQQSKWASAARLEALTSQPGFAAAFLPRGRAPQVGEVWALPAAARTLRAIAATQGEAFYRGEVAAAIAAQARAQGGALTEADLAGMQADWVQPLAQPFAGHALHELPPNGQGLVALIALGLLQHTDLERHPVHSPAAMHLQIEAIKLAFADVHAHVADPQAMRLPPQVLLDAGYLKRRAMAIDPQRAQRHATGWPERGGTIYLAAADPQGQMVSFIQSNYLGFGSGVVVEGWGIALQNRGHGFSLDAGHPNAVAPGKRPFHTIIPAMLTDADGRPDMAFGVMGAHMQPQGHVQTLLAMLLGGANPQAACDAPRWRFNQGLQVDVEWRMPASTVQALAALGHEVQGHDDRSLDFGAGQFIRRIGAGPGGAPVYAAASDPRRDGQAVGLA